MIVRALAAAVLIGLLVLGVVGSSAVAQAPARKTVQLKNLSRNFLQRNLQQQPRLGLTAAVERRLRDRLDTDPVVQHFYQLIKAESQRILKRPLLTRKMTGKRLLDVSRTMLERMNILCLVYRLEKSPQVLSRINDELLAVADFDNWNPKHFLDVGEMSLAVAVGLDWTAGDLPPGTIAKVKKALIDKGLKPGGKTRIVESSNNWNQVCNGGMIAAALTVADTNPKLAADVIQRAIRALPNALSQYGPDGAYPEGASYWEYATLYTACTSTILQTSLGSDFGMFDYKGVRESAMFQTVMLAPSEQYFNYGDGARRRSKGSDLALAWFATKTGDATFFEKERFLSSDDYGGRFAGFGLIWISHFKPRKTSPVPAVWTGRGANPVAVFQGPPKKNPRGFYFGCKGGSASVSHGNMDAGSFVFELDGVRWALDPGRRSYYAIEKTGFKLWDSGQDGQRWNLLTKNNFGHNTLTVNGARHLVGGKSELLKSSQDPKPKVTFDLTPVFGDAVIRARRTFVQESDHSVLIADQIVESRNTKKVVWQMLTTAKVEATDNGVLLSQSGQTLRLQNVSFPDIPVTVVALDPPPLDVDIQIKGLKRLEIHVPVKSKRGNRISIEVRLTGE